jgi:hypothetical protein
MKPIFLAAALAAATIPTAHAGELTALMRCDKPASQLSLEQLNSCEMLRHFENSSYLARQQAEADERARHETEANAKLPHADPSAVSLCPKPRRMTRDGCWY